MNSEFVAAMRQAALSTRAQDLRKATRVIQAALSGQTLDGNHTPAPDPAAAHSTRLHREGGREHDGWKGSTAENSAAGSRAPEFAGAHRMRRPLGEVVAALRQFRAEGGALAPLPGITLPGARRSNSPPVPEGARFVTRSFTCPAGTRTYKLYIPAPAGERPRGLIVMLHGCKQDPDDFAAGTRMNDLAEAHGLLVAYPGQTGAYNASSCWNWFDRAHQERDLGEPAIIAGITREIASEFGLDRQCVFVAGLSAGGAMAVVMGETYPDLYAAVGVHSGLAYGSANDVISAFAAMRGEAHLGRAHPQRGAKATPVRTIVFQGSADRTVHPSNADRIVAAASPDGASRPEKQRGTAAGRTYTRTITAGPDGLSQVEHWCVEGTGHAWSGGHSDGSYTDFHGPDASAEMVRFFLSATSAQDRGLSAAGAICD